MNQQAQTPSQDPSFRSNAYGVRHRYLTFRRLVESSWAELDAIFARGVTPQVEDLQGWEFRGVNTSRRTRLLGIRKFKKGFYQDEEHPDPFERIGYNVPVRQNATFRPHLALPNELEPKRFGYFLVTLGRPPGPDNLHPEALMLDYSRGPANGWVDPSNLLRDYLIQVDPNNRDLFLGKAYTAIGPARVFVGYFVLERYNQIGL